MPPESAFTYGLINNCSHWCGFRWRCSVEPPCPDRPRGVPTTVMGSSELSNKVFGYAERNVASAFEFAERLVQVRDFQSLIRVQTDFIQAQMQAMTDQAKESSAPKPTQSTGSKGEFGLADDDEPRDTGHRGDRTQQDHDRDECGHRRHLRSLLWLLTLCGRRDERGKRGDGGCVDARRLVLRLRRRPRHRHVHAPPEYPPELPRALLKRRHRYLIGP